ncbi:DUF72 domain-containing protein [Compostibacter hankyongensis]|uniref:DUF72 domain-containing protein n=1 Tax=Compostibacter hankyongensis TaxID=1007089 RepID=A0ABP8FPW2_9BACT
MDFGKVSAAAIDKIDFRLPDDPPLTRQVLAEAAKSQEAPVIYTGCAKWGRKEWVDKLYPPGTKERDFLSQYVTQFNSIELNATHYKIYEPETIRRWSLTAGKRRFLFCPKFPQVISHEGNLYAAKELTAAFLESIRAFETHLGPCFLQFSEHFSPGRRDELYTYLSSLPRDLPCYLELRHPQWFGDAAIRRELFELLRKLQLGAVITDTSGRRDCAHMELPIPGAFVRFVGNNLHPTDYRRIDEWVLRIKSWLQQGLKQLYFFMHQHDEKDSPELCLYLIQALNKHCGTKLEAPRFQQRLF